MSKYPLVGNRIRISENPRESEQDRRKYNIHVDRGLFNLIANSKSWYEAHEQEPLEPEPEPTGNPNFRGPRPGHGHERRNRPFDRWQLDFDATLESDDSYEYPLRGEGIEIRERYGSDGTWGRYSIYVSSDLKAALIDREPVRPDQMILMRIQIHTVVGRLEGLLRHSDLKEPPGPCKDLITKAWKLFKCHLREKIREEDQPADLVSHSMSRLSRLLNCLRDLENILNGYPEKCGEFKEPDWCCECTGGRRRRIQRAESHKKQDCVLCRINFLTALVTCKKGNEPGIETEDGWVVLGYIATDIKVSAAAGDAHCSG